MKLQYLISKDIELTPNYICKAIKNYLTKELPRLNKCWNYYLGKQKITKKKATDTGKPCNVVVANYCNSIVNNYLGYLAGKPISYTNDSFEEVIDILRYNDVANEDTEYLRSALIYGRAFECNYIDEEGKQRFKQFDTKQCLPIYSNSLNGELLYVVRFYREDLIQEQTESYIVEVYGPNSVRKYSSAPGFNALTFIEEAPHYYGQCPVTVFSLNEDEESIFEQVISLQDAYNTLISSGLDDFDSWADAYLVLKGITADSEDIEQMKANRVLIIDNDSDAHYLTKDSQNNRLESMLTTINDQIHKISNSPDFTDDRFLAQSGEALKYKLVGFETNSSNIESCMKKALQRRIELICNILSLTYEEGQWRDVLITFTRNIPNSLTPSTVDSLIKYKGLISDSTLLGLVPFVSNPEEELKKLEEQNNKELNLYGDAQWIATGTNDRENY